IITHLVAVAQKESASEVVKTAILDSGYAQALKTEDTEEAEGRLENLQELVNAAVDYDKEEGGGLRDFIDSAALVSDADQYRRDAPVTLMTMHAAKGLEFPLVFIVGLEDGLFPHARSATDKAELEEERRYTGKTYDSVDSIAEFFRQRGRQLNPSNTAPAQQPTIRRRTEERDAASSAATSSGFVPGTHVRHPKYGRGLVLRREGTGDAA